MQGFLCWLGYHNEIVDINGILTGVRNSVVCTECGKVTKLMRRAK